MASFAGPLQADNENVANVQAAKGAVNKAGARRVFGREIGNLVGPINGRNAGGKENAAAKKETVVDSLQVQGRVTRLRAKEEKIEIIQVPPSQWGARKPRMPGVKPGAEEASAAAVQQRGRGKSWSQCLEDRSEAAMAERAAEPTVAPPSPLPDIDAADRNNPLAVVEYANDIFRYFKGVEPRYRVAPDYMSRQTDINDKMRAILIDWLVEVHFKFKLMPETLFLTVNLIDRFLELRQVTRRNLQLVGVTAMLIASKYEEIWAPEVRDYVYISDRAYTREQILAMEKIMLNTLKFNLTVPTPYPFLTRFSKANGTQNDKEFGNFAQYLVELSLPEYGFLRYPPSLVAAAAVYAANLALNRTPAFPHSLLKHSGYTEAAVRACAVDLARLQRKAPNSSLTAVFKKWGNDKFQNIAKKVAGPAQLLDEVVDA